MSGSRSTRNWLYENRPSTHRAAITIVAKTGLLIETRVNHMAGPRWRYERGGDGVAEAEADGDDDDGDGMDDDDEAASRALRWATIRAGAPSFRLSKRTARIRASAARPLITSTRPACALRRPVTTMRRTSAPFSSAQTKSWPEAWPTAPS